MTTLHMFFAVALAAILDMATTLYMLHIGGREANPIMASLFATIGPLPVMLVTRALVIGIAWMEVAHMTPGGMAIIAAMWWGVVFWNVYQIWRQRRGS
jgi:multisubunit Na+/H+ antiporter MnhC subunit